MVLWLTINGVQLGYVVVLSVLSHSRFLGTADKLSAIYRNRDLCVYHRNCLGLSRSVCVSIICHFAFVVYRFHYHDDAWKLSRSPRCPFIKFSKCVSMKRKKNITQRASHKLHSVNDLNSSRCMNSVTLLQRCITAYIRIVKQFLEFYVESA